MRQRSRCRRKIIADEFAHWDDIDVHIHGEMHHARRATASSASAASGCSKSCRTARASSASCSTSKLSAIPTDPTWRDYDLVIAADGINRRFRDAYADAFGVDIDVRANKFVWLGTSKVFDAFTFAFEETEPAGSGPTPIASRPTARPSSSNVRRRPGAASASTGWTRPRRSPLCEKLFAKYLDGQPLHVATPRTCAARRPGSTSAGSSASAGTTASSSCSATPRTPRISRSARAPSSRSRMRSSWPRCSTAPASSRDAALDEYQAERNLEVLKLQNSARNSTEWFETLERYLAFRAAAVRLFAADPQPAHQPREPAPARPRLAGRRRALVLGARRRCRARAAPPMFAPFKLREMTLENRITVSPMAMYSAVDGTPNDFHFVHLRRARAWAARAWSSPR